MIMSEGLRGVAELMAEMRDAPEPYRPSPFWDELAAISVKQLEGAGFNNFKRTVNMMYFNWDVLGIVRHQLLPVLSHWLKRPTSRVFTARFSDYRIPAGQKKKYHSASNFRLHLPEIAGFNPLSAWVYRTYVAMLWEYVSSHDRLGLLSRLDEPAAGNPFLIEYRGRHTSQDLCNSVHEFYSAGCEAAMDARPYSIAELGGGYGRLAYACLKALPTATYSLIDIAPALNIAQEYLARVFAGEKIFFFRPFQKYSDVQQEFEAARIRFLAAHQIELLPPKHFDLFINISSLHEMTYEQIERYLQQIDRLCRGRFYTKQWISSQAKVNGVVMREHDYPIPKSWITLYHTHHPIQRLFFHALHEIRWDAA
jgi:putative sugar O-methyltransferase